MVDFIRQNTLLFVIGLFAIKYLIQFYYTIANRKQKIVLKEKPFVNSRIIWLNALIIFGIFIFQRHSICNNFIGLITLLIGIIIGIFGIFSLNKNYHDNLVIYENSNLIKNSIYSVVRHPIRLGICLETFSIVIFINSILVIPLFLLYLFLNYKRTKKEEKFLILTFNEKAIQYYLDVPQFNILKGIFLKFNFSFRNLQSHLKAAQPCVKSKLLKEIAKPTQ